MKSPAMPYPDLIYKIASQLSAERFQAISSPVS